MREPTKTEVAMIQVALDAETGGERAWEPDPEYIGVIDAYISDGPGWTGKAAIFLGGEVHIVTLALFEKDGTVTLSTHEMESWS